MTEGPLTSDTQRLVACSPRLFSSTTSTARNISSSSPYSIFLICSSNSMIRLNCIDITHDHFEQL
ncbi:16001_t:CDS:1, partial [Dentiscutata heterogama]